MCLCVCVCVYSIGSVWNKLQRYNFVDLTEVVHFYIIHHKPKMGFTSKTEICEICTQKISVKLPEEKNKKVFSNEQHA